MVRHSVGVDCLPSGDICLFSILGRPLCAVQPSIRNFHSRFHVVEVRDKSTTVRQRPKCASRWQPGDFVRLVDTCRMLLVLMVIGGGTGNSAGGGECVFRH